MTANMPEAVKQQIAQEVKRLHPRLVEISHAIHANPELAFNEKKAAGLLTAELEQAGFTVTPGVAGLETAFNALRQMLKPGARMHGVITHGGDAANIIPDYAAARILLRAREQDYLEELERRFAQITEGAALATGARFKLTRGISYKTRICRADLRDRIRTSFREQLGREPQV